MRVYKYEGTEDFVELSFLTKDIHNVNSPDYFEIAWEIKPLLGCKELISLYINNLYLIIIDDQGGYKYKVYGRYITKQPFISNPFCMTAELPKIWEKGADEYTQEIMLMLKQWVKILRNARKNHLYKSEK